MPNNTDNDNLASGRIREYGGVSGNINTGSGVVNYYTAVTSPTPSDVQKIAAAQIGLLTEYYNAVLFQAKDSYNSARTVAVIGSAIFMVSVIVLLATGLQSVAVIGTIGGAIVEAISGLQFYLYSKTSSQLSAFHTRLARLQNFLLANSICESLTDPAKSDARTELIKTISTAEIDKPPSNAQGDKAAASALQFDCRSAVLCEESIIIDRLSYPIRHPRRALRVYIHPHQRSRRLHQQSISTVELVTVEQRSGAYSLDGGA